MDDDPASDPAPRRPDSGLGLSGRRALAATVEAVSGEAAPPERLGKYQVSKRLGRGAFGDVYLGYDTELRRDVALKLLRDPTAEDATERLRKEAQAMAALDHPALLTVYGMGEFEGRVFIAMAYAEHGTMRDWLREAPRTTREIALQVAHAARGLHAAHEAGFVHRDVKPSNILIGNDGQARVADFGLVYSGASMPTMSGAPTDGSHTALGGTPPYMAPELFDPSPPSARSDEFALCITLYEALFERRPRWHQLDNDQLEIPAARERPPEPVPKWLRVVLSRGLQSDPQLRYPTLAALAEALEHGVGIKARRTRVLLGAATVSAAAVLGWTANASNTPGDPCSGGREELAGVWDAETTARVGDGMLARDLSFARSSWESLQTSLDAYAEDWVTARREACLATAVRRDRSAVLMDKAMMCLEDRRRRLAALVEVVEHGGAEAVATAPMAAGELPPPGQCNDTERLLATQEPPPAEHRAEVAALSESVARVDALRRAGSILAARALLDEVSGKIDQIGYEPLLLDARRARASVATASDDAEEEMAQLLMVYGAAVGSGRRDIAGAAAQDLAVALSWNEEHDAGARWIRLAEAASKQTDEPASRAKLAIARGSVQLLAGHPAEAVEHGTEAVRLLESAFGTDDLRLITALRNLAHAYDELGEAETAGPLYERALRIAEGQLGAHHPAAATIRLSLADLACKRGEFERCEQIAQQVLDLREQAFGATHPSLGDPLVLMGDAAFDAGRLVDARALYERANEAWLSQDDFADNTDRFATLAGLSEVALAQGDIETGAAHAEAAVELARTALPSGHPRRAGPLSNLARIRSRQGEAAQALALVEEADDILVRRLGPTTSRRIETLAVQTEALLYLARPAEAIGAARAQLRAIRAHFGDTDPMCAQPLYNIGLAYEALEDFDAAQREYQASLVLLESEGPPDHPSLTYPLTGLARAYVGSGQPKLALAPLVRSLELAQGQPQLVVDAQVTLVKALVLSGGEQARAAALADEAAVTLRQLGGPSDDVLEELATFRKEHGF